MFYYTYNFIKFYRTGLKFLEILFFLYFSVILRLLNLFLKLHPFNIINNLKLVFLVFLRIKLKRNVV